ncbi:hypothetical protein COLO4_22644 [Corchorus olitorius]|uniref:RNase H type-1 domain-containing protein n=1 Tax=Corchorus olitorius TaxID=93759 RepID=A0A1R3IKU3_9ROSI|nr:hypothetical protein COLO4_22644 [Corchorus olitorius]
MALWYIGPGVMPRLIGWEKPDDHLFKINTDGSSIGNPDASGSGGIIIDHCGNFVTAFSRKLGNTNCLTVELWGIRDGLAAAINLNLHNKDVLEADSAVAVSLINLPPPNTHILSTLLQMLDGYIGNSGDQACASGTK